MEHVTPPYGSALAVQTVNTQFGDNFSEWNAGYGRIVSGRLYLMLTGNLEANFNKLEIFIDSKAGGQSVFDSSGNDNAQRMDGLVFDPGFTADYHVIVRRGNDSGNDKVRHRLRQPRGAIGQRLHRTSWAASTARARRAPASTPRRS